MLAPAFNSVRGNTTMPNTVPAVTGAATHAKVSFRYIDANGQLGSDSYVTTVALATAANVNAAAVALGAASNANVYEATIESVWRTTPTSATAVDESRESVKDNIVTLFKDNVSNKSTDVYIPAPLDTLLIPDTNQVEVEDALYLAVELAFDALLPTAYSPISVRFSEHKGVNKKTRR